jgi:excisionase family DNA binding protein
MTEQLINEKLDMVLQKLNESNNVTTLKGYFNLKETINYTGLSKSTLVRAIQKGELKVSKASGRLLFRKEWVDKWLSR